MPIPLPFCLPVSDPVFLWKSYPHRVSKTTRQWVQYAMCRQSGGTVWWKLPNKHLHLSPSYIPSNIRQLYRSRHTSKHWNVPALVFKVSMHSFKRFTSRSFLKIYFSVYAPVTFDECYAWFHLNAVSPAERNTEQVNITKNVVHGRIRTPKTARPPDYKSTDCTTRLIL